jgi:hypothetical protein
MKFKNYGDQACNQEITLLTLLVASILKRLPLELVTDLILEACSKSLLPKVLLSPLKLAKSSFRTLKVKAKDNQNKLEPISRLNQKPLFPSSKPCWLRDSVKLLKKEVAMESLVYPDNSKLLTTTDQELFLIVNLKKLSMTLVLILINKILRIYLSPLILIKLVKFPLMNF